VTPATGDPVPALLSAVASLCASGATLQVWLLILTPLVRELFMD